MGLPNTGAHLLLVTVHAITSAYEQTTADGAEPVDGEPEAFRQYLLADLAKCAKLVKESGAKLD
jgi:hypothetical protein